MHPNLCVCFHSAVTFWLNDRLTGCKLHSAPLNPLTKCLPWRKMSRLTEWASCLTLPTEKCKLLDEGLYLTSTILCKKSYFSNKFSSGLGWADPLYTLCINPSAVCFLCSSELINIFARSNLLLNLRWPQFYPCNQNVDVCLRRKLLPKHFNLSTRAGLINGCLFMETFSNFFICISLSL